MRIGCLCVTERRPHLVEIAVASFLDQIHENKRLLIVVNNEEADAYFTKLRELRNVVPRPRGQKAGGELRVVGNIGFYITDLKGIHTACERLDMGCRELFELDSQPCDVVATWDDDDWKDTHYLEEIATQLEPHPEWLVTGYLWGLYVNARHLWAEDLSQFSYIKPWGFWGASLAYRKEAWQQHPFTGTPFPGYDPHLCNSIGKDRWAPPLSADPYKILSFCHGQNCVQHCRGGGFDLKPWLEENVSERSRKAIFNVRQWFIDHNVEPPQVNRTY